MADDDAALEGMLAVHSAAVLEHVAAMRAALLVAAPEQSAAEPSDAVSGEDADGDKASLLKRNMELAAILGHTQRTVSEQEVCLSRVVVAGEAAHHLAHWLAIWQYRETHAPLTGLSPRVVCVCTTGAAEGAKAGAVARATRDG
jgi:hypothetical protein